MQTQAERETDLAWIAENHEVLASFAVENYQKQGRGAVVIDMAASDPLGQEDTFRYAPQGHLPSVRNPHVVDLVDAYSPDEELVVILLPLGRSPANYQVPLKPDQGEGRGAISQAAGQVPVPKRAPSGLSRYPILDQIWGVVTAIIQVAVLGLYIVGGGFMSIMGLGAVGGGGATKTEAVILIGVLWTILLVSFSLSVWLHLAKNQRVLALLVLFLPMLIFWILSTI